jgi:hypothetical protein
MDNVQKYTICNNVPSSETFRSCSTSSSKSRGNLNGTRDEIVIFLKKKKSSMIWIKFKQFMGTISQNKTHENKISTRALGAKTGNVNFLQIYAYFYQSDGFRFCSAFFEEQKSISFPR